MLCEEAQPLIDSYLDGELDLVHNLDLERHLEACKNYAPVRQRALEIRSAIRQGAPYFRAPLRLEQHVLQIARDPARTTPRASVLSWPVLSWRWMGAAAAIVLVVLGAVRLERTWLGSSHEDLVAQEIVAGHIRS